MHVTHHRKPILIFAVSLLLAVVRPARAGFTLVTDAFPVSLGSIQTPGVPSEGAPIFFGGGHLTDYIPETSSDPVISPLDISRLRFGSPVGLLSAYEGRWQVVGPFTMWYDDGSGDLAGKIDVGSLNLFGTFDPSMPSPVDGSIFLFGFTQNPTLQAIDAGGNLYFDGIYTPGAQGTGEGRMQGIFRTSRTIPAPVPEPGSLVLLAAGLAPLMLRRRRR